MMMQRLNHLVLQNLDVKVNVEAQHSLIARI